MKDALYNMGVRIPLESRRDMSDVLEYMNKRGMRSEKGECMVYFYKVWNRYMVSEEDKEDYECGKCRSKVFNRVSRLVDSWNKYGYEYD